MYQERVRMSTCQWRKAQRERRKAQGKRPQAWGERT
jgi:hypothetical protein